MLAKYNNIDSTDLFSDIHGHRVACVKRHWLSLKQNQMCFAMPFWNKKKNAFN